MHEYGMNPFDYSLDELNFQSVSAESNSSYRDLNPESTHNFDGSAIKIPQTGLERPAKQLKTGSWNSCTTDHMTSSSSSSQLISFENSNSPPATSQKFSGLKYCTKKPKKEAGSDKNTNFPTLIPENSFEMHNRSPADEQVPKRVETMTRTGTTHHGKDHVIAERKRREKLNQRFIALSAVVPGLRKVLLVN